MKKLFTLSLLVAMTLLFSNCQQGPCSNKDKFLDSFDGFVSEVKQKSDELNDDSWVKLDEEFKEFTKVCYPKFKKELNGQEKKEYWANTASYYSEKYDGDILSALGQNSSEIGKMLESELGEAFEELQTELKNIFDEDFKDDLKGAIDEMMEGLGELGEELKKGIDEINTEK